MAAGTPHGWGVAVICGTGSIALGRSPDGQTARAGGWGYLLGDEGSGYAIGLACLRAVLRAHDGRGPQTELTRLVLAHYGLDDPSGLVPQTYEGATGPAAIAALAALVEAAALSSDSVAGDAVARGILRDAGSELALAARAVVQQLALAGPVPCGLAGGVIVKGTVLRAAFVEAAAALSCDLAPVSLVSEPARGAVSLALGQAVGLKGRERCLLHPGANP